MFSNKHQLRSGRFFLLSLPLLLLLSGCLGSNLGVEGGAGQLATKFAGIGSVTILSPTSVTVGWTTVKNYENYQVYVSTQDTPVGSSVFDKFKLDNLSPGTAYSFSVAGVKSDGSLFGSSVQKTASTWEDFAGPSAAEAVDPSTIKLAWNYHLGPEFRVYYKVGSAPTKQQVEGAPQLTTQSATGINVTGLLANSTYYFTVVAKYQDGTLSLRSASASATTLSAQFTSSQLLTVPQLIGPSQILSTEYANFTVSGAPATYVTTIYNGAVSPANQVAVVNGSGTAQLSTLLAAGTYNFNVKVTDSLSGAFAYAVISGMSVLQDTSASQIIAVSATTPTSLDPVPVVAAPASHVGPFPYFTVSGGLSGYKTEIFYNSQSIGSVLGNGTIYTLSSKPLPRGQVTVQPVVTYNGEAANLAPITLKVLGKDPTPYVAPTRLNGGGEGAGFGWSSATGDFNCDGYADVALGGPLAPFTIPGTAAGASYSNGAVIVFYGTATGLDRSLAPSTAATGTKALLIPAPAFSSSWGQRFGISLASGNLNGSTVATRSCDALIVGADADQSDRGAIFVYYGSPTGLQVAIPQNNSITCGVPNGYTCQPGKYYQVAPDLSKHGGVSIGGFGASVATGDYNGDGYKDVLVGDWQHGDTVSSRIRDGAAFLFLGTPNGLSPAYKKILLPAAITVNDHSYMGTAVAMAPMSDNSATNPKSDLLISVPGLNNGGGNGGGVIWIKGGSDFSTLLDASGRLADVSAYSVIQPAQCSSGQWGVGCGNTLSTADVNLDGYAELLIGGQNLTSTGGTSVSGAFFVYYGSVTGPYGIATVPALNQLTCSTANTPCPPQVIRQTGVNANYRLGNMLASLGDTNGDTYPDVGVGAYGANRSLANDGVYNNNGEAKIYYGSALGLKITPQTTFNISAKDYSWFGRSMVAGNFRGTTGSQAYRDVLIGAPGGTDSDDTFNHGFGHIFNNVTGTGFGTSQSTATHRTNAVIGYFSAANFENARIVGDLNGDGFADVAAPYRYRGRNFNLIWGAIIYYGSADGLITSPDPSINPVGMTDPKLIVDWGYANALFNNDRMAESIVNSGDMNGDGYNDLVVGSNVGMYFFFGSSSGLITTPTPSANPLAPTDPRILTANTSVYGPHTGGNAPNNDWSTHGKFNDDVYEDIAWAVWGHNSANPVGDYRGAVFVIYGSADGPVAGGALRGQQEASWAAQLPKNQVVRTPACTGSPGSKICQPQVICLNNSQSYCAGVGASDYLPFAQTVTGHSWVFPGAVEAVGDTDGDGMDELALTDPNDDAITVNSGALYIVHSSGDGLSANRHVKLLLYPQSMAHSNRRLYYLTRAGDVNGDGLSDFVVSADQESVGPGATKYSTAGAAYLVYGVNGGYKAASGCGAYPCNVAIDGAAGNVPDGNPLKILDNRDDSCNISTQQCNVLRFYPTTGNLTSYYFGRGILGTGDLTGDNLADLTVATNDRDWIYFYTGAPSGLNVAGVPKASPTCSGGVCTPTLINIPMDTAYTTSTNPSYSVRSWQGTGDIDQDGSPDFLISTRDFRDPTGGGYYSGGFYLFH